MVSKRKLKACVPGLRQKLVGLWAESRSVGNATRYP
jgi:hypothetical protein